MLALNACIIKIISSYVFVLAKNKPNHIRNSGP